MAKYRQYNKDFKLQAARLVTEQGYSLREAGQRLGISAWSIQNWVKKFRHTGELPPEDESQPAAEVFNLLNLPDDIVTFLKTGEYLIQIFETCACPAHFINLLSLSSIS